MPTSRLGRPYATVDEGGGSVPHIKQARKQVPKTADHGCDNGGQGGDARPHGGEGLDDGVQGFSSSTPILVLGRQELAA